MVRYPVVLEPDDNGTLLVTFPDFPEAATFGDNEADALARASEALATIVDGYIRARRPLPRASNSAGLFVELSALMSAKAELYDAMHTLGVSKSELGRKLQWHQPQVDRLLDLNHGSQVHQLDAAAKALGGSLRVSIEGIPSRPRVMFAGRPHGMSIAAAASTERVARKRSSPKPRLKKR